MADIRKIWISKNSKWNEKEKKIEEFYECDLAIEGEKGLSMNLNITGEMLDEVFKIISPALKDSLNANLKALPNEIR